MAEKPKPDLDHNGTAEPGASDAREAREPSSLADAPELAFETPEALAARASEDLLAPQGLPSETSKPPDAILLTGFLGASGRTGYRRLYLDVTLKDYVDILNEDVRHLEWAGTEQSVFGRKATLWIRRGAALEYTTTRT